MSSNQKNPYPKLHCDLEREKPAVVSPPEGPSRADQWKGVLTGARFGETDSSICAAPDPPHPSSLRATAILSGTGQVHPFKNHYAHPFSATW